VLWSTNLRLSGWMRLGGVDLSGANKLRGDEVRIELACRPNIEGISQGMAEGRCEEVLFSRGASLAPGAEGVSREGGGSMLCCVMGRPNEAPINDAVVELAQPPSVVGGRADWGPGNM